MISNNIKRRIEQIKLYESHGAHSILEEHNARILLSAIPAADLANPAMTYCDPQCGSGSILLVLADILMQSLVNEIPDPIWRLHHIFSKQIFANDINHTQAKVVSANFKRALNDREFPINVTESDCFTINTCYNYIVSAIEFETIDKFVPKFKEQSTRVIIAARSNKTRYSDKNIWEMSEYRFLGISADSKTPMSMMVFDQVKRDKTVIFCNGTERFSVNNPPFLPGADLTIFKYAVEILAEGFEGYEGNYGPYYSNADTVVNNPGTVPLIFNVGTQGSDFTEVIKVSKRIVNDRMGVGKHKIVISKNGNRGKQSIIKYADPIYGTGHNTLWVEVSSPAAAKKLIKYWNTVEISSLCRAVKSTNPVNGIDFWKRIPHLSNYKKIKEIYDKYYKS